MSWPTSRLRELTLIDTPGIASISTDLSARTLRVLTPEDDRPPVVDAVLYLLRHTHASDVRFLESFHDDELGARHPDERGRRAVPGRRDRVVPAGRAGGRRAGGPAATSPSRGCDGCAR